MEPEKSVFEELVKAANEVFGIKGWSHEVVLQEIDFIEGSGKSWRAGCNTTIRVVLDSGRFHQECGYSDSIAQTRGLALYKARSSSSTNALKKTFFSFGEMIPSILSNQKSQPTDSKYLMESAARKRKAAEMQYLWNQIREKKSKDAAIPVNSGGAISVAVVDKTNTIEIEPELQKDFQGDFGQS